MTPQEELDLAMQEVAKAKAELAAARAEVAAADAGEPIRPTRAKVQKPKRRRDAPRAQKQTRSGTQA